MKTLKKIVSFSIICFPLVLQSQSAPTLQELVSAAMAKDAVIEQQNLESKSNLLDQQKLKDVFLPKIEFSGKTGYVNATARLTSPEITLPAIQPVFPGAAIPKGSFNNNFTLSGFEAAAKAEAKF